MENEFQNIGKKMPYRVPDGFFEHITGNTLAEARRRRKGRKFRILLLSSVALAASLAAMLFLFTLFAPGIREKAQSPAVQNLPGGPPYPEKPVTPDPDRQVRGKPDFAEQKKAGDGELSTATENESIESVLASIDDEELMAWVQSLRNDTFTEITENSIP
jgi:hypothetical protein